MGKQKNLKDILKSLFVSIFIVAIVIGTGFGFSKISNIDSWKKTNNFNVLTKVEVDVEDNFENIPIEDIAQDVQSRLSWYGYSDGTVAIVDNDTLQVSVALDYINYEVFTNDEQSQFGYESLIEANNDFLKFFTSIFSVGPVEFRSATGELLFDYDETGKVVFQEPSAPSSSPTTTQVAPTSSSTSKAMDDSYDPDNWTEINSIDDYLGIDPDSNYSINLIDHAALDYRNGQPMITIYPNDYAYSLFSEAATYLSTNYDAETNPQGNVVAIWIGYDTFSSLIRKIDPESAADPLQYALTNAQGEQTDTINPIAEPFLLDLAQVQTTINPNAVSFSLPSSFGREQAESAVQRINFSNNYSFSFNNINWEQSQQSVVLIKVMMILFLVIAVVSVFFTSWYLGLLGMLVSSVGLLSILAMSGLGFVFGVKVGFMFFVTTFLLLAFTYMLGIMFMHSFRQNVYRGLSMREHFNAFGKTTVRSLILLFIFVFPIIIFSLIKFDYIRANLMLLLMNIYLIYFVMFILALSVILIYTLLSTKTQLKEKFIHEKWNFFFGTPSWNQMPIVSLNQMSEPTKTKAKNFSIVVFAAIIGTGALTLGVLQIVGGGFNKNLVESNYYRYDIVRVVEDEAGDPYYFNSYDGFLNGIEDPWMHTPNMASAENDLDNIYEIFKGNDVYNISSNYETTIVTNEIDVPDEITFPYDPTIQTQYDFGYSVYTKAAIDASRLQTIDSQLKTVNGTLEASNGMKFTYYYKIDLSSPSLSDGYTSYDQPIQSVTLVDHLLILIIVFLIFIFAFIIFFTAGMKLSGVSETISMITLETLSALFILPIIYAPVVASLLLIVPLMLTLSLIFKYLPIHYLHRKHPFVKEKPMDHHQLKNDIRESFEHYNFIVLLGVSVMILIGLFGTIIFGLYAISSFIFILVFGGGIVVNHLFILPNNFETLELTRRNHLHNKFTKYWNEANSADYLDEEYIKAVNY